MDLVLVELVLIVSVAVVVTAVVIEVVLVVMNSGMCAEEAAPAVLMKDLLL